ncbi:nitrogen fixation protein NifQ [Aquabacter cavernae]|uniref:nitrogen fixation protein NifQ n=1 Tax=Aquabacter cavernae TaxID=2496029 RepID=UPI001FE0B5B1|nr:nitrogen fixation protein NifQ [Aquabacter cavernae]
MGRHADGLFSALMGPRRRGACARTGKAGSDTARRVEAHLFDAHVFACAIAVSAEDALHENLALGPCLGLDAEALETIIGRYFTPRALACLGVPVGHAPKDEEGAILHDFLHAQARPGDEAARWLAAIIACRALRPNHLWQDLGLRDRGELNRLLATHFPALAAGNTTNMKWKKYFYRRLCEQEGFVLCTAPSCAACDDFDYCFGEETGESRLARTRRSVAHAVA